MVELVAEYLRSEAPMSTVRVRVEPALKDEGFGVSPRSTSPRRSRRSRPLRARGILSVD
jgi:hypothetical protein